MKEPDRIALISLPIVILLGLGLAFAGSQGGTSVFGMPLYACLVGLAFLIQWVVCVHLKNLSKPPFSKIIDLVYGADHE